MFTNYIFKMAINRCFLKLLCTLILGKLKLIPTNTTEFNSIHPKLLDWWAPSLIWEKCDEERTEVISLQPRLPPLWSHLLPSALLWPSPFSSAIMFTNKMKKWRLDMVMGLNPNGLMLNEWLYFFQKHFTRIFWTLNLGKKKIHPPRLPSMIFSIHTTFDQHTNLLVFTAHQNSQKFFRNPFRRLTNGTLFINQLTFNRFRFNVNSKYFHLKWRTNDGARQLWNFCITRNFPWKQIKINFTKLTVIRLDFFQTFI